MILLSLSTSSPHASAALIVDGRVAGEIICEAGVPHSVTALNAARDVMRAAGVSPKELDGLAVDIGPGSFTGVRIGVSAVNAMAFALDKPVYPVSSLAALTAGIHGMCCSIIDARNGNCYAALYENGRAVIEDCADTVENFLPRIPEGTAFAGDGAIRYRSDIERICAEPIFTDRIDVTAAEVALSINATAIEASPLYLRPSQAERVKSHE